MAGGFLVASWSRRGWNVSLEAKKVSDMRTSRGAELGSYSDRRFWRQSLAARRFCPLESQRQDVNLGLWRNGRIAYPDFAALGKGDGRLMAERRFLVEYADQRCLELRQCAGATPVRRADWSRDPDQRS